MTSPGLDPLSVLLGDLPTHDGKSYHDLMAWAVANGLPDDPTAGFLLCFLTGLYVQRGAPPLTLARVVARFAELAEAEVDRRRQGGPK